MSKINFKCCKNPPKFLVKYSVAGEEKVYSVCDFCSKLECYNKHIVKKEAL